MQRGAFLTQPHARARQLGRVFQAQREPLVGEPRVQLVPLGPGQFILERQFRVPRGAVADGSQQRNLVLRAQDGAVGFLEVVEVADELAEPGFDVVLVQHVGAHKVGDVLHLLHGHCPVEQLHGLVPTDTELPLERSRVRLEGVVHGHTRCLELLLQLGGVLAEVGEVPGDGLVRSARE